MRRIRDLLLKLYFRVHEWINPPFAMQIVEGNLPKKLKRRIFYIVQEDGFQEHAAMLCPCGCGAILQMNLLPDERPCWRVMLHADGTVSLNPSVWRQKECGSHFWFRHSRVKHV